VVSLEHDRRPPWLPSLVDAVDVPAVVGIAQALMRCESVNPPGDERETSRIVAAHLKDLGAHDLDVIQTGDLRASVVARWGSPGGRVLAWNGHTDVVSAGDESQWTTPPFTPTVRDGRLWGRGAVDMKGPVACLLHALTMIERAGLQLEGEVAISVAADEETGGSLGSGYLAEQGVFDGIDAGICGEPSSLNAVVAARGRLWLELTLIGKGAHASQPELGANAVLAAAHVLQLLNEVELGSPHPLLGGATLTPTMIEGGSSPNSVPDRCTITIDRRLLPSDDAALVTAEIRAVLERVRIQHGVDYEIVQRALFVPTEIDPESEIVVTVQDATELAIGRRAQTTGMAGSTDARFLIGAGVPTVIFGPGDASAAHVIDESIAIEDLRLGALAYAAVICRFLGVQ
jgi:acetylornithine deacetylase/succinyl-diaminopimelate desuccinylase family protein